MQTHSDHTEIPTAGPSSGPKPSTPRTVMWAAIGLALTLFGLLLALGWGPSAGTTAGAFLLLACVAVCIWAVAQGRSADREVDRAIARMAAARRKDDRRRPPKEATDGQ